MKFHKNLSSGGTKLFIANRQMDGHEANNYFMQLVNTLNVLFYYISVYTWNTEKCPEEKM
jgi:hypothetical protein